MHANYYTRYLRHAHIIKAPVRKGLPKPSGFSRPAAPVQTASALPRYLKLWWICASPLGLLFAARIVWEKFVLVRTGGPDLLDFSLTQLYPTFGIIAILCCFSLLVWLLQAISCLITEWRKIDVGDVVMVLLTILIALAVVAPERFFA